jgi:hypothetical protein
VPAVEVRELSEAKRRALALADNIGKCRELLAIELPELAELLVLEGLDIAITGTEKLSVLRRRKRWLITVWLEVRVLSRSLTNMPPAPG